jgi:hypothetical protein
MYTSDISPPLQLVKFFYVDKGMVSIYHGLNFAVNILKKINSYREGAL